MRDCICPCGARYHVDEASVGKRAKCKKCGVVFKLEPEELGVIAIKEDPASVIPITQEANGHTKGLAIPVDGDGDAPPVFDEGVVRAAAVRLPSATSAGGFTKEEDDEPVERFGYVGSLAATALFPFSLNNAIVFAMVVGLLYLTETFIAPLGYFGLIVQFLITGLYCAFRFKIIEEAAAGERDLPTVSTVDGWLESAVIPFFSWIGTWLIVLLPATICLAFMIVADPKQLENVIAAALEDGIVGLMDAATASTAVWLSTLALGLFAWPMLALCVSVGGFATLSRPDLMIATIVRTFPVYFLTVALVIGSDILRSLVVGTMDDMNVMGEGYFSAAFFVVAISVYLEIIALRCIGLYYHHFKHRFAWSWG